MLSLCFVLSQSIKRDPSKEPQFDPCKLVCGILTPSASIIVDLLVRAFIEALLIIS